MPSVQARVCVVIAAYDAEATISRAIASALEEPEVAEVIVVDDSSRDGTCEAAAACDDGTGRLQLIRCPQNGGPAAARNLALDASAAPLVSILDSDDFFVPGRFRTLLDEDDWDMIADNIVFVPPETADTLGPVQRFERRARFLGLAEFVEGNISQRGRRRGEIGFLKPVMRRAFLEAHGLRYGESLRLGEDYDLYARALACGARYKVVRHCGYVAVERPDSLSGLHRTEDLQRLGEADEAIMDTLGLDAGARSALVRHRRQIHEKFEHRRLLDRKREGGIAAAVRYALSRPAYMPAVAGAVLRDKLGTMAPRRAMNSPAAAPRYLFREGMLPE